MWRDALDADVDGLEAARSTAQFRMGPARGRCPGRRRGPAGSNAAGRELTAADLRAGALHRTRPGSSGSRADSTPLQLGRPRAPGRDRRLLRELTDRAQHRELVLREWSFGRRLRLGHGVPRCSRRLRHRQDDGGRGDRGRTGARPLRDRPRHGRDKYIGETEKNLDRIFDAADDVNPCCSSTRPTRSSASARTCATPTTATPTSRSLPAAADGEVRRDRDPGDEPAREPRRRVPAPARRVVDFPLPDEEDRRGSGSVPARGALADGIDLDFLAGLFELSGGNIRTSRSRRLPRRRRGAADRDGRPDPGPWGEHRKLGRLCSEAEFGPHTHLVAPEGAR